MRGVHAAPLEHEWQRRTEQHRGEDDDEQLPNTGRGGTRRETWDAAANKTGPHHTIYWVAENAEYLSDNHVLSPILLSLVSIQPAQ